MGKQPVAIIIARHGARLDAADKSWHLSSPTPYDPPLTYGGWNQSRALGLRVSSLLQSLVEDQESAARSREDSPHAGATNRASSRARRKKLRIIIHSSPFQRCVQTSIGISAGISQFRGISAKPERSDSRSRSTKPPSRLHAVDTTAEEVAARSNARNALRESAKDTKTTLRLDAFLGEWLSPEYFDLITPPPASPMMLAGAKAELLRRGEDVMSNPSTRPGHIKKGSQGSLWSSARASDGAPPLPHSNSNGPLDMKQMLHALPGRDRTSSYSNDRVGTLVRPAFAREQPVERPSGIGYIPPVPTYALSPGDPIPPGYVAHARNACVDFDMQWDSIREPLAWGDGGEYGEEWSAMHKRFRKGLGHLIEWYDSHGAANLSDDDEAVPAIEEEDEGEVDEDVAVVLVTHGAGCNALIGALTNQPVLLDVGMASVTMAVRRGEKDPFNGFRLSPLQSPTPESSPDRGNSVPRHSSPRPSGLSSMYEMKLVASADHLRPGIDPARPLHVQSSSPVMAASKTIPESRRRSTLSYSTVPSEPGWNLDDGSRRSVSSALGSIRRLSTTQNIPPQRLGSNSSGMSMTGLWSPTSPSLAPTSQPGFPEQVKEKLEEVSAEAEAPDAPAVPAEKKTDIPSELSAEGQSLVTIATHNSEIAPTTSAPSINTIAASPHKEAFDSVTELPKPQLPVAIGRTLSQKGLWGSAPSGIHSREHGPKRRWTLQQD